MFLEFYQLREQPFGVTPDPRYLYFSPGHREALASLLYGIETGRGFLSLVAEPGMGKTTLLFHLLHGWKGYVHSAFLFQTQCDSKELVRYLLHDLGLNSDGKDFVRMHSELNQFLFRETLAGRRVAILIDEAQNLADSVLETIRLLSNFEATDNKFLQIVLAGQPELAQRLGRPGMAQMQQRIAVQARLDPLPAAEVVAYINHRLQVAGYEGPELFTPGALALIAARSRGIPRLINHLCFNALSMSCAMQRKQVTSEVVREAATDLSLLPPAPPCRLPSEQVAVGAIPVLRPAQQSLYSWIADNLFRRRLLVLSLVAGSLVMYFGVRSGARLVQPKAAIRVDIASAPGSTPSSDSPVGSPAVDQDLPPHKSPQASSADAPPSYFTYAVQPGDTLRSLCVSGVGRYNAAVLYEIKKLNSDLKNPDHLEVGQKIRLPLNPTN